MARTFAVRVEFLMPHRNNKREYRSAPQDRTALKPTGRLMNASRGDVRLGAENSRHTINKVKQVNNDWGV